MAYKEKKPSNIARLLFSILLIILGIWALVLSFTQNDRVLLLPGILMTIIGLMMLRNTLSKKY